GIKVAAEAQVIFFGMTPKAAKTDEEGDADAERGSFAVVTIATGENFYGAPSSSIKVSEFSEFPTKGRATSGVRAHKFLKGGAGSLRPGRRRRAGGGSPLAWKTDVIGTRTRLGGAESRDASAGDGAGEAEDPAAEAGGASAEAAPAARGGKPKSAGTKSAGAKKRGQQGLATSVDELELDLDDAKDEIARAKFDTEDAVIVSHDDDDDDGNDGSALF